MSMETDKAKGKRAYVSNENIAYDKDKDQFLMRVQTAAQEEVFPKPLTITDDGKLVVEATLSSGDIQIGAVEIKNADTDDRLKVNPDGTIDVNVVSSSGGADIVGLKDTTDTQIDPPTKQLQQDILSQLDVVLSTRASESTLASVLAQLDRKISDLMGAYNISMSELDADLLDIRDRLRYQLTLQNSTSPLSAGGTVLFSIGNLGTTGSGIPNKRIRIILFADVGGTLEAFYGQGTSNPNLPIGDVYGDPSVYTINDDYSISYSGGKVIVVEVEAPMGAISQVRYTNGATAQTNFFIYVER